MLFLPVAGVVACSSGSASQDGSSADGGAVDACASDGACAASAPDGGVPPDSGTGTADGDDATDGAATPTDGGADPADGGGCTGTPFVCHGSDTTSCCAPDPYAAMCSGGQWVCGGVAPPGCDPTPSCNGGKFACGAAMCDTATQFCATLPSGDGGSSTRCMPLPAACSGDHTCSCLEANEHDASCSGSWACVPYFGVQLRATCM